MRKGEYEIPMPAPTYKGHLEAAAGPSKYDKPAPSLPPEDAPGFVLQTIDRYRPQPFLGKMTARPCRPCYPPQEYLPAGVASVKDQLASGNIPSTGEWPADKVCYQPPSEPIALPVNYPNRKVCSPSNPNTCCMPTKFSLPAEGTPDCCQISKQAKGTCCKDAGAQEKRVHFADENCVCPSNEQGTPQEAPMPLPPAQPAHSLDTRPAGDSGVGESGVGTACYEPKREQATSGPAQETEPCYCYPPAGEKEPLPPEGAPCFLPQPEDAIPSESNEEGMGPIGPWATGKVDWGPLAGMTGTRPVVDRYSVTRFSRGEWRKHNEDIINRASNECHHADIVRFNCHRCKEWTSDSTDKSQETSTKRLRERGHTLHNRKCELEQALNKMAEEMALLELQRQRLKTSMGVLQVPEAIAGECLERRAGRLETDLVRDVAEEELIKEVSLMSEVRDLFQRLLKTMEDQLMRNKTVKDCNEMDWTDKKEAHDIETINISLKNSSPTLMFRQGATRFPEGQSTPESWEFYTKENLGLLEAERLRSVDLRSYLDKILTDVTRDLRTQADRVDAALEETIAITLGSIQRLEKELLQLLRRIADTEILITEMRQAVRNQDNALKKAQTRLSNRMLRSRTENCRDHAQYGLVDEVKTITENVAALSAMLNQAEATLNDLTKVRGDVEREIMVKRKTLEIDRDRCKEIRSHYPSASALAGH